MYAFAGSTSKKNAINVLALPANLTSIGEYAFSRNNAVAFTSIPDGIEVLSRECFYGCNNVCINTFGGDKSKLTTIKSRCFRQAGQDVTSNILENLYFGIKVVNLEDDAFTQYGSSDGAIAVYTPNSEEDLAWNTAKIFGANTQVNYN